MAQRTSSPAPAPAGLRAGTAVQFGLLALAWGMSFLFIKVGLESLEPVQVTQARLALGACTLGLIMVVARLPVPRDPVLWGHLAVVSVLLCVVPFTLYAWAEQEISSGLASIYNATTPLMTMVFAAIALHAERLTGERAAGLGLGFAGVLVLTGPWAPAAGSGGGDAGPMPHLACLGATVSYGLAYAYLRRHVTGRGVPAVSVAFVQVTAGTALALLLTPWAAGPPTDLGWPVALSMVALGAVSTGLAYVWNTNVVHAWGASHASAVTYLTPVVGVTAGVIVLDEALAWNQPVGAALVIAGILTAHGRLAALAPGRARRASRITNLPEQHT